MGTNMDALGTLQSDRYYKVAHKTCFLFYDACVDTMKGMLDQLIPPDKTRAGTCRYRTCTFVQRVENFIEVHFAH